MKRLLTLLLLVPLCAGCKGPAPAAPAATTTAAPASGAPGQPGQTAQPGQPGQPFQPAVKPVPGTLPEVLARVNGESVERWELENAVKQAEARAGSAVPADQRDQVLRGMLDQLVAFHLLAQESRARKLDVTDAEVDAQLATIRKSFPTEQAYQQNIAAQGLTADLIRRQTRMILQAQKLIEVEVNSKVSVADAEVDAFYKQNPERFKLGDTVHASHILIGVPQTANAAQKLEARARAQEILKRVKSGADFAKAASEMSDDQGSAPGGGDLGILPEGPDDAGLRGGRVQAQARRHQRSRRIAVRLPHHQGARAPRRPDDAPRRSRAGRSRNS